MYVRVVHEIRAHTIPCARTVRMSDAARAPCSERPRPDPSADSGYPFPAVASDRLPRATARPHKILLLPPRGCGQARGGGGFTFIENTCQDWNIILSSLFLSIFLNLGLF